MNVLIIPSFIYNKSNPSSGSFFFEQAEALHRKGHNVYLLFCDTYSVKEFHRWLNYSERNEEKKGIHVFRKRAFCPLKHGSGFYGCHERFAKEILTLYREYLADKQIDIIHAHCCAWAGYAAMKLSEETGIPYVITEHSSLFGLYSQKIKGNYFRAIKQAFSCAKEVLCVSEALCGQIVGFRQNAQVVGNVIDCGLFSMKAPEHDKKDITFLTVLYMKDEQRLRSKGVDILVQSFAELIEEYPAARLLIGGSGDGNKVLEKWIQEKNLSDHVSMLGALSRQEVAEQMQQCDVFVLPSRYETFGVVYAEAMACGKPVIATRTGGPDSFVTEETGILIDAENQEQLKEALLYMVQNYQTYDSKTIRTHIENLFSMDAIGEKLTEIYRGCL